MNEFRILMIKMTSSVGSFKEDSFYKVKRINNVDMVSAEKRFLFGSSYTPLSDFPVDSYKYWSIISIVDGTIFRVNMKIGNYTITHVHYVNAVGLSNGGSYRPQYLREIIDKHDYSRKNDIIADGRSIILREGHPNSLYRLSFNGENRVCLENIINRNKWTHSVDMSMFKYGNPLSNGITREDFNLLIPNKFNAETFKPIDSTEIYNNCKNL